jgi:hypothetical protein
MNHEWDGCFMGTEYWWKETQKRKAESIRKKAWYSTTSSTTNHTHTGLGSKLGLRGDNWLQTAWAKTGLREQYSSKTLIWQIYVGRGHIAYTETRVELNCLGGEDLTAFGVNGVHVWWQQLTVQMKLFTAKLSGYLTDWLVSNFALIIPLLHYLLFV